MILINNDENITISTRKGMLFVQSRMSQKSKFVSHDTFEDVLNIKYILTAFK